MKAIICCGDDYVVEQVNQAMPESPILAVENIEETYPIPRDLIGCDDDVFMLSVCGDSMINAGILDHDYIIARKQNFANNGDIVVASATRNDVAHITALLCSHKIMISLPVRHCNLAAAIQLLSQFLYKSIVR